MRDIEDLDLKVTESRPVVPVQVSVIGTGDGRRLPSGTEAETPGPHQPNIIVQVVTPIAAITIRFVNTFLTVMLGILTGAMATDIIPAADFFELAYKCAGLAVSGACVGLIKDLITIFGRLEQKNPLLTGSI
jgi:hypothetical protein